MTPTVPQPNEKPRDRIERLADLIRRAACAGGRFNSGMFPGTPFRVARAVVDEGLPEEELLETLDAIAEQIDLGEVDFPDKYTVRSLRNLLSHHGIPWRPRR
jgi:hypothetical protein